MNTQIIAVVRLFLFAAPVGIYANVGESVDEILSRYGKENLEPEPMSSVVKPWTEPDPKLLIRRWFRSGPVIIAVEFFSGKAVSEAYLPAARGDLSQKQIKEYLAANAAGGTWRVTEKRDARTRWVRSDGKLLAWKHSAPPGLRFYIPGMDEVVKKDAEERKRRTEGRDTIR